MFKKMMQKIADTPDNEENDDERVDASGATSTDDHLWTIETIIVNGQPTVVTFPLDGEA